MPTPRLLTIHNRQRTAAVDRALLRRICRALLSDLLGVGRFDLGVYLVGAAEMIQLNENFLRHRGVTDVIAFDYAEPSPGREALHAEVFVCVDEARAQARRFRTTWQTELVRYLVHAVLHLQGYDDQRASARKRMKREEDRLVRQLSGRFSLGGIGP